MIIHCDSVRFINEVLENKEYGYLFTDLVVIDVGCNVGAFSLYMLPHARQIHAVDLSIENINMLNKTIADNEIKNIKTYNVAISDSTQKKTFNCEGDPGDGAWRLESTGGGLIQAYTLNDFMAGHSIPYADVLKLDVEGEERKILDSPDFPVSKIHTIIGERHGDAEVKGSFERLGYRFIEPKSGHFLARRI